MDFVLEFRDLGELAAENDSKLDSYFYESKSEFTTCLDFSDKKFVLLGRTGSGKSAILKQIEKMCESDNDYLVSIVYEEAHNLAHFTQRVKTDTEEQDEEFGRISYKIAWYYTIIVKFLEKAFPEGPSAATMVFRRGNKEAYDFVRNIVGNKQKWHKKSIIDWFVDTVNSVEIKVSDKSAKVDFGSRMMHQNQTLREVESFIENTLPNILGAKKLFILIDDIDKGWNPNNEYQQKLISSLFSALSQLAHKDNIKPLLALRTNILRGAKHIGQREKTSDNILNIRWTRKSLRDFLTMRIQSVYQLEHDFNINVNFFSGNIGEKDLIDFMIDRTLMRPRDLLALCKDSLAEATSKSHIRILPEDIESVLEAYSLNRIIALHDEWAHLYPDLTKLFEKLASVSKKEDFLRGYTPSKFKYAMESLNSLIKEQEIESLYWFCDKFAQDPKRLTGIIKELYFLGVIVIQNTRGELDINNDATDRVLPEIKKGYHILVHPVYVPYLEAQSSEIYEDVFGEA